MNDKISSIWHKPLPDKITNQLCKTLEIVSNRQTPVPVFFRADDIAHVDEPFRRLMRSFLSHEIPLCLAVVPEWFDKPNWLGMQQFEPDNPLWCWHQHGRSHINYQRQGKKCEFGEQRSRDEIEADLVTGRRMLRDHLGDLFYPVFTPPWNRCSQTTLELLSELKYMAVSRSRGAKPSAANILPDLAINIDLHTRKETDFTEGWENLLYEFSSAAEMGCIGIMLHHQLMNEEAFVFLDQLLALFKSQPNITCVTFRELPVSGVLS